MYEEFFQGWVKFHSNFLSFLEISNQKPLYLTPERFPHIKSIQNHKFDSIGNTFDQFQVHLNQSIDEMKNVLADIRTTVSTEEKFLEILYRKMLRGERPFQTHGVNPLEWILSAGFYSVYHKESF